MRHEDDEDIEVDISAWSKEDEDYFTKKQPHAFASVISRRTGYSMAIVCEHDAKTERIIDVPHVVVYLPDGDILDASGTYSEDLLHDIYMSDETYIELHEFRDAAKMLTALADQEYGTQYEKPNFALAEAGVEKFINQFTEISFRPEIEPLHPALEMTSLEQSKNSPTRAPRR